MMAGMILSGSNDVVQALYARAVADALHTGVGALPELYTEAMDAEQIWLQLDMQLGGALKRARRLMRKAGDVEQLINPDMEGALKGAMLTLNSKTSSSHTLHSMAIAVVARLGTARGSLTGGIADVLRSKAASSSLSIKTTLKLIAQQFC